MSQCGEQGVGSSEVISTCWNLDAWIQVLPPALRRCLLRWLILDFRNQNIPRHDFSLATPRPLGDLRGCGYNSYTQKPLEGSDDVGIFSGCLKKKPSTNWEDWPWMLEWIGVPSDRLRYFPSRMYHSLSSFWTEPRLEIRKFPACVSQELGEGMEATGFHFTCFDLLDLTYVGPEKAPRHWSCQRWQMPFQGIIAFSR